MAASHETVSLTKGDLNRLISVLAIVVLVASVALFCLFDITLRQGVAQALLIAVIPNITASVFIYLALFYTFSRLDAVRQQAAQRDLVEAIISGIRASAPAGSAVEAVESSSLPLANIRISAEQQVVIQRFLEAMFVFATSLTGNPDLRLYCHLADFDTGMLHPVCVASGSRLDDDYRADIPFRGPRSETFIIGRALRLRRIVAGDLASDHLEFYPDGLKTRIPANLKCVIAAPIESYSPGEVDRMPLGTIAFDSTTATCAELGFTDADGNIESRFDIMMKSCSRALYHVLMIEGRAAERG
jgi:hypothetical protein